MMIYNGTYNWQQPDWPHFRYDLSTIHETLLSIAEKTGLISGKLNNFAQNLQNEAPPSQIVPKEMEQFIHWFNDTAPDKPQGIKFAPVRAAIAHLYFESIHPFEDGNGRIGRAIAEKALSQGFGYPAILSLSQADEGWNKGFCRWNEC
jgi:Fic family protein